MTTGFIQRFKGKIIAPAGSLFGFGKGSGASMGPSGSIVGLQYADPTGVGNTNDTTEDILKSFALPANSLDQNFRGLWIYAAGVLATNAHSKTAKLYFGASSITTGASTGSNVAWVLEMLLMRSSAGHQVISGQSIVGATHGGAVAVNGTDDETTALTIKVTGQTGTAAANDVVLNTFLIQAFD